MNTKRPNRLLSPSHLAGWICFFVQVPVSIVVVAQPAPDASISDPAAQRSPSRPCVLLRNGSVLLGTSMRLGDDVTITRSDGSTISLPRHQIAATGNSLRDLYEYRLKNRFEGDLKKLQADVRWSLRNDLVREAADDVLRARELSPTDPHTVQLLRLVADRMKQDQIRNERPSRAKPEHTIRRVSFEMPSEQLRERPSNAPDQIARHDASQELQATNTPLPLAEHSINTFATKVQPILLNRCVSCHHHDQRDAIPFRLHSARKLKWAPRRVADENLREVLRYVDVTQPGNSLIRIRATDGHGGRTGHFGKTGSAMLANLDFWLGTLRASETVAMWQNVIDEHVDVDSLRETGVPPTLDRVSTSHKDLVDKIPAPPKLTEERVPSWQQDQVESSTPGKIRRMPKVQNPFDPAIFNRRVHGN